MLGQMVQNLLVLSYIPALEQIIYIQYAYFHFW